MTQTEPARNTVLFLCPHNAAKSVIAAAYVQRLATDAGLPFVADSAGTEPDDAVSQAVIQLLRGEGLDVSRRAPRRVTREDLARADCDAIRDKVRALVAHLQADGRADPAGIVTTADGVARRHDIRGAGVAPQVPRRPDVAVRLHVLWLAEAIWVMHAGGAGEALAARRTTRRRRATGPSIHPGRSRPAPRAVVESELAVEHTTVQRCADAGSASRRD